MELNSIEINKLSVAYANGSLTKEVLDHMLQLGYITIYDWVEISCCTKIYLVNK